jgi:uncharacterized C2H2 Zn-finger protein
MRLTSLWRCPYCSKVSPRHWNMGRHIVSQHGLLGEPVDSLTGLTRVQSKTRRSFGNRHFNSVRQLQLHGGSWPSYNNTQNDRVRGFWEWADRTNDIKELKIIKEMQGNLVTIMQQNSQIIALLTSFLSAR